MAVTDEFDVEAWHRNNDNGLREAAKGKLDFLVSGTFVCQRFGFTIEEIGERIDDRTMVGFKLGFLGPWLPEWQFVEEAKGQATVSPIALELREAWGEFNLDNFVKVMATSTAENVPVIGQSSTYAEMVQLGLNPLEVPYARSLFQNSGVDHLG